MTGAAPAESSANVPAWLRRILRCPVGHCELIDASGPDGQPELQCVQDCGGAGQRRAYPIEDGIPVLLADEARVFTAFG